MRPHGTFAWNELASSDVEGARAFYTAVLGWEFEEFALPGGAYWIARSGGEVVGGLGGLDTGPPGLAASAWIAWVEVDDVEARVQRAREAGAEVLEEPCDTPNVGRVAVVRDPAGAVLGLMTSGPSPTGPA